MSAILGTDVILQFLKDDSYQTFVCATECSIQTTTEVVDVRTINGGKWKKKRGKSLGYKVSLNGLIDLDTLAPSAFWLLENFQLQLLSVQFRMVFTSDTDLVKIMQGVALIETSELTSSSTSFANGSFDFVGDGAYTIETATACPANIVTANVSSGDPEQPGTTRITYELANTFRLEYSVDGGGRETIFDPGDSGEFFISGLTDGNHTITLYAICETGAEGDTNTIQFQSIDGEPGNFCSPPDSLNVSAITANSAFASWFASPAPADGYYYELVNLNTSAVVQSGSQTSTIKTFSGLTPGTPYRVRVRAICEEGVSESAFITEDFTTTSASCNVPGEPIVSNLTDVGATVTWTAPIPAPADGYAWDLLIGSTIIYSANTSSLSVDLPPLTPGTTYTFRVKAICGVGNESGFNSVSFTTLDGEVEWSLTTDGTGFLNISGGAIETVSTNVTDSGSFLIGDGYNISIEVSDPVKQCSLVVTDVTDANVLYNSSSPLNENYFLITEAGHDYTIVANIFTL